MKILVTGGLGFIGSNLIKLLINLLDVLELHRQSLLQVISDQMKFILVMKMEIRIKE